MIVGKLFLPVPLADGPEPVNRSVIAATYKHGYLRDHSKLTTEA